MNEVARTLPWQARAATATDLAALAHFTELHDLAAATPASVESGSAPIAAAPAPAPPPAPAAGEHVWVAAPGGGAPQAALRLRQGIGRPQPRGWFRLGWAVHASAELGLYQRQRTLLLGHDLTGADELFGFALAPGLAPGEAGPAWAALLQAAAGALGSDSAVPCIAELPGLADAEGRSPVWQGLGRHFLPPDFLSPEAAQQTTALRRRLGPEGLHALAGLMPRHLLYASLLQPQAQAALGEAAAAAQPLLQALQEAGFGPRGHIALVDGGPVLERWPAGR